MADKIIAAVRLKRKVLEGTEMQVDIDTLLQSFSRKVLFARPGPETERLKRELVRAMRTIYLPEAVVSGRKSAIPILERIGSESVTAASRLTGDPLKFLSGFTQKNIAWFTQEVNTGTVALSSELKAELARATRDGVSKQRMITRVIDSYDAELRSLKRARKNFAEANKAVANAEATGDIKAIRAAKKVRSQARAATTRVTTAMGRLENKVQREATDAVRREAQRAQQAAYRQAGFTVFTWVAVNGSDACPDCEALHGETRSQQQWHGNMPGDGHTVCLDSCICELVPEEFTVDNKSIAGPVNPFLPTLPANE